MTYRFDVSLLVILSLIVPAIEYAIKNTLIESVHPSQDMNQTNVTSSSQNTNYEKGITYM
jgi:hypothetical protein